MRIPLAQVAVIAVLLIGAGLRTVQYAGMGSMSAASAAVALNVIDRDWYGLLTQPQIHNQVTPVGFLLLVKLIVRIAGDVDGAYRLIPYLFSLASLVLFWRVSIRYLHNGTLLAALIVFSLSPALVLFAAAVKQYSVDIAVCLFLLWVGLRYLERPFTQLQSVVIGIGGGVAILLSQPGMLIAFGVGLLLLVYSRRLERPVWQVLVICGGWFVGAAITTYTSMTTLSVSTQAYMHGFWGNAFMPRPWSGLAELFWIPARVADCITFFVALIYTQHSISAIVLKAVYVPTLILGFVHLTKRDVRTMTILAVPFIVSIAASAAHVLPLTGRVSLFLGPSLVIGSFAGFDRIRTWLPKSYGGLSGVAAVGVATLPALAFLTRDPPPMIVSGAGPVLREVRDNWQPQDELVVASGEWARISVEFYGRRVGLEDWNLMNRLAGARTTEEHLRGYLRSIDAFRGAPRAWFYFEDTTRCEEEAMLGYLSAIGRRLHSVYVDFSIYRDTKPSAHLYDLSNPALLSTTGADRYPTPDCPS